jgi:hypothetical protein
MTMNDITIIVPVHKINDDFKKYFSKALRSIANNTKTYSGKLYTMIVCPTDIAEALSKISKDIAKEIGYNDISIYINTGKTDFCSQINAAVSNVNTDMFSILEYDDEYASNWFSMLSKYYYTNEDVSLFLPINVQYNEDRTKWQFCNEIVWASSFSNELGFIDFDCLQNCSTFNLTGGVFNTQDFIRIGMLKPSIKIAFNYEFLLRLTNTKLKAFVVPKEGYSHVVGRKESLTEIYSQTIVDEEIGKWFELAMREYSYNEDRNKDIVRDNTEEIK